MASRGGYGQFCPIAMAAEIVCTRWTALVLRELLCGSQRFSDLRRGLPSMSPSLLSKRLTELEHAGLISSDKANGGEYRLTEAGEDLRPVIMALGEWGQRWVESDLTLKNLDPSLLMWDMRRNLNPTPLPPKRCTIQFRYPELASGKQNWWLLVEGGHVDLCLVDPGREVDLYVTGSLRAMTAIWMGLTTVAREIDKGTVELDGDREIASSMQTWLGLSGLAGVKKRVAA
jgi:DNA-binding HxlR family transcriptional regulator